MLSMRGTVIFAIALLAASPAAADEHADAMAAGQQHFLECRHAEAAALREFEKAAALKPDDPETLFWAGRANFHMGEFEKARDLLEKAAEISPDDYRFHAYLAYTYGRLKKLNFIKQAYYQALAVGEIDAALELNPSCADCYAAWAQGWEHLGLLSKAENSLLTAIKHKPKYVWLYALLGGIRLRMEKPDEARKSFEQAVAMAAADVRCGLKNDEVPRVIALFYEDLGFFPQALEMAQLALSWNPGDVQRLPAFSIKKLIARIETEIETGEPVEHDVADELIVGGVN